MSHFQRLAALTWEVSMHCTAPVAAVGVIQQSRRRLFLQLQMHPNHPTPGSVQFTVYSVQCTVYSVQCTVYSVQCTVYSVHCTVYTVQFTLYIVQCIVYTVQCTVYIV